jgi:hypothetical protein
MRLLVGGGFTPRQASIATRTAHDHFDGVFGSTIADTVAINPGATPNPGSQLRSGGSRRKFEVAEGEW